MTTTERDGTVERTPDGGLIRYGRDLAFPVEEVWASITEPARMAEWWPPLAATITVDLREGGSIIFDWPDHDIPRFELTILRLEAPTLLEHTHTSPGAWMRWELEPAAGGTRLRATYFVRDPDMAIARGDVVGGVYSLDRLEHALAGHPIPWDDDAFDSLRAAFAERGLATVEA